MCHKNAFCKTVSSQWVELEFGGLFEKLALLNPPVLTIPMNGSFGPTLKPHIVKKHAFDINNNNKMFNCDLVSKKHCMIYLVTGTGTQFNLLLNGN